MRFTKMEGLGNDFVVINRFAETLPQSPEELAVRMCDRHFGVGADGILLVGPAADGDLEMRLINADGSEAEMCGNGLRCVALYAYVSGLVTTTDIRVSTLAGIKPARLETDGRIVRAVRVDMGPPEFEAERIPVIPPVPGEECLDQPLEVNGKTIHVTGVSMGNPHAVIIRQPGDGLDPAVHGPAVETHPAFPRRTNVEFVTVADDGLHVVVWERGAGFTMACGTGACAVLAAAARLGISVRKTIVTLPGGSLEVEWAPDGRIYMTGPARLVFTGDWPDAANEPGVGA